jgi:protein gp37
MNKTNITWADYTWNPITGCTNGCDYCYARKVTERWSGHYPNGFAPTCWLDRLCEPEKLKKPSIIFVGSMGDLFDPALPKEFVAWVFDAMAMTLRHTFMLLTKRPERVSSVYKHWLENTSLDVKSANNVLFGFTAINQKAYERGMACGPFDFISFEPLFGSIDLNNTGRAEPAKMELVIVGAQTPGRPLHEVRPEWLDSIIKGCDKAGVPLHYKHQSKNPEYMGKVYNAMIDGRMGK